MKFKAPLYMQAYESIVEMITSSRITPGSKLSIRSLMQILDLKKNTLEKAINMLKDDGIVYTIPKSGTIVSEDAWQIIANGKSPDWHKIVTMARHKSGDELYMSLLEREHSSKLLYKYSHSFSEKEFQPHEHVKKLLKVTDFDEILDTIFYRTSTKRMTTELKESIVEHVSGYGIKTNANNILVFKNILQAYNTLVYSLLRHGSNIIKLCPDLIGSMENFTSLGVNRQTLANDKEGILPDSLLAKVRNRENNILSVNPVNHYPIGITTSETRRGEILEICQKYKVPIIENDMLRELWHKEPPPPPFKSDDKYDQIIYIGTFDTDIMCRYGFSWMIAPSNIINRLKDVKCQLFEAFLNNDHILTPVHNVLLRDGLHKKCMEKIRSINQKRLPKICDILHKHLSGIAVWDDNMINYHLMLRFDKKINSSKLFLDCDRMTFLPGAVLGDPSSMILNTVCESVDNFELAMIHLAEKAKIQLN